MPRRLWGMTLTALALAALVLAGAGRAQVPGDKGKKAPANARTVRLTVLLPFDDDLLTIEGKKTASRGTTRKFESPEVEPGKKYSYTLVAVIQPNNYTTITRTKKVTVEAGKEFEVDMRAKDPGDKIVIRYVPTEEHVVEAMCKLANVGKDDVVFDLGCGDGRIVITAVSKYGAKRGVGVDIDPERIAESKDNAKEAKVQDKVEFRRQDVLHLKDLSDATVVMLYMGDEMNLALRPILWKALKPGTRVVSHRFTMGDWKPEKVVPIEYTDGDKYNLYLWTITGKEKEGLPGKGNETGKGKEKENGKEKRKEKEKGDK